MQYGIHSITFVNKPIIFKLAAFLFLFCFSFSVQSEDKIYKYTDENGVTVFTATPPSSEKNIEEVKKRDTNVLQPDKRKLKKREVVNKHKSISNRINTSISNRQTRKKDISLARELVAKKKKELEEGKVPLPGERQALANGFSRLLPSYYERVGKIEEELASAEKKLKKLISSRKD